MAITYPTTLDSLTNPTASDKQNSPALYTQLSDLNDIAEALQAKVGVDSSAVTSSHDYKLSGVTGSDKAVSKTGTETLTNKTLSGATLTNPTISGTISGDVIVDEDDMASDSATKFPSQQSVKAYVDNSVSTHSSDTSTHGVSGNLVGDTDAQTLNAKTLVSPTIDGALSGSAILDEDDMVSDSASAVPTQQSVKAYVDSIIGSGEVIGPNTSVDNAITRFNGTTGKVLQNSSATINDNGSINIPTGQSYTVNGSQHTHAAADVTDFDTEVSNNTDVASLISNKNLSKVTASDTTADYLSEKITASSGLEASVGSPSGDETVSVVNSDRGSEAVAIHEASTWHQGLLPYVGATNDVNLGEHNLEAARVTANDSIYLKAGQKLVFNA